MEKDQIHVNQLQITVGASVGIAIYPDDGTTSDELIRQADKAMYLVTHAEKKITFGAPTRSR